MGNKTMNTREKDRAHSLASLPFIICAPNFSCACNAFSFLIGSFLISGCCDCDIPDCTASNYKETSHCTSTSVVLGIPFFFQRFGARNRSLQIREIQSFRLKKIYLHILSNSVNMCLK